MKQYLLSVHYVEGQAPPSPEVMQQMYKDVDALNQVIKEKGEPSSSTVVSVKNGEVLMTDGPFAEAKEHIGGFWIIKAADLDAALEWAKKATVACQSPVEVRPFQDEA
jgi:hypothetical protein